MERIINSNTNTLKIIANHKITQGIMLKMLINSKWGPRLSHHSIHLKVNNIHLINNNSNIPNNSSRTTNIINPRDINRVNSKDSSNILNNSSNNSNTNNIVPRISSNTPITEEEELIDLNKSIVV